LFGTGFASTFRPSASVDLPHAIDRFERRIIAFGKLYQPLSNGSERRYISVGDYGGALCRAQRKVLWKIAFSCQPSAFKMDFSTFGRMSKKGMRLCFEVIFSVLSTATWLVDWF